MNKIVQSALFTDFYELTMAQGYWKRGVSGQRVVFDYFFRRQPFSGGYSVFAGLGTLLDALVGFRFTDADIRFLETLGIFDTAFLKYLTEFSFKGTIHSVREGEIVFPQEPLLRVDGDLVESQIIEGIILNTLNFQSLVATKSARVWLASGKGRIMEFGLRRAQGSDGAVSATRAAYIGGAFGTSNTLAGNLFGIPLMGTMAHSWIMSYPNELESFKAYAEIYPKAATFLIDTYNTLESGIGNAIAVGRELAEKGLSFGVRLDSGDIDYLSREVRARLDEAGLQNAKIVVSNELDEGIIEHLVASHAPIDVWGVGTNLVTGGNEAAFTGVYKLSMIQAGSVDKAVMKFSDNPEKSTNPAKKDVFRLYDDVGRARLDLITLEGEMPAESVPLVAHHPSCDYRQLSFVPAKVEPLLRKVMEGGRRLGEKPSLAESRQYFMDRIEKFDTTYMRQLNPHIYKVSLSDKLKDLKLGLLRKYLKKK